MKSNKYISIYNYLKEKIILGEFNKNNKLPSEKELTDLFNVSRNTVRRAIDKLSDEGFVSSVHGKGVFLIESKPLKFLVGGLESFKEASIKNNLDFKTDIVLFEEIIVDKELSKKSNFSIGTKVLNICRVRNINKENTIIDINYFDLEIIKDITIEIAGNSIYEFIENNLKLKISGAQKIVSVQKASKLDKKYLGLKGNDFVAVISNFVYLDDGRFFEYTESRHIPDKFTFSTFAKR